MANNLFGHFGKKKSDEVEVDKRGDDKIDDDEDRKVETDDNISSDNSSDGDRETSSDGEDNDDPPTFRTTEERKAFLKTDK